MPIWTQAMKSSEGAGRRPVFSAQSSPQLPAISRNASEEPRRRARKACCSRERAMPCFPVSPSGGGARHAHLAKVLSLPDRAVFASGKPCGYVDNYRTFQELRQWNYPKTSLLCIEFVTFLSCQLPDARAIPGWAGYNENGRHKAAATQL